jgi:hypothetical protein
MAHKPVRWWFAVLAAAAAFAAARDAGAIRLNEEGTINLSVRAYVNARIGTMAKQSTRPSDQPQACIDNPNQDNCNFGGTYPYSGAGHVIQNRYFLEMKWNHSLVEMFQDVLPESVTEFKYNVTYRGEYDGIYDFGPSEYRQHTESFQEIRQSLLQNTSLRGQALDDAARARTQRARNRLRAVAPYRNRLFQAFVDWEQGPVFLRIGRQNLAWGETDVFRLLDNINPIDNSFGGFFLELDERRVPLDMIRTSYNFGTLGPLDQAFLEGYVAFDRTVAFIPGAPAGSPWATPLGPPIGTTLADLQAPNLTPHNLRGGARFVFNASDYTFTLASYQTMFDIQAVRFRGAQPTDAGFYPGVSVITAEQFAPLVWVNGASMTTAFPSLKSVLRMEFAWFKNEALFRGPTEAGFPGKGTTAQFVNEFLGPVLAGTYDTVTRRDTYNIALGWDSNQYIRFLNPSQTFFFTTQFFVRHIDGYGDKDPVCPSCGFGLPVPEPNNANRIVPVVENQFLHTFAVNTTYNTNVPFTDTNVQVTPGYNMFYDWQGMLLFQPNVRFVRDPWRFLIDYTTINSGVFRPTIGLVRDRSNVRFQVEYVL